MRKLLLALLLVVVPATIFAQERRISGRLADKDTKEALMHTTVQLLRNDSSFVKGTVTDDMGNFALSTPTDGKFIVKITSVGYATYTKNVVISAGKNINLGNVAMKADAIMLKGVTATAQAMKVTVNKDTFVYNSAAYRTPEGSVIEELVKRLPGAQVDDDGTIKINGQEVKKIKVDGKEFMTGDTKTALKNLPTSIIDKIKAYKDRSDQSKATGIDDGIEEMTLDFGVKPGMNKGILSNNDLAYGTQDRYAERLMGGVFKDAYKVMAFGNFNNTNDMGFGGRGGGFGRGRNGLNTSNMVGINFNYEKKNKLQTDFSVRWNHGTNNSLSKSSSERFVTSTSPVQSFSNSISQSFSKNKSWNFQGRMRWTPDTMTTIMFRPSFSISDNDGRSASESADFSADPYTFTSNPLAQLDLLDEEDVVKNSRINSALSYGDTRRVGGTLMLTRKFGSMGRNISLNLDGNYSSTDNKQLSTSKVTYYSNNSTSNIFRYNVTPSKNYSYNTRLSYAEPLIKNTFLQFSYTYKHSYSKSDRATYNFTDANIGTDYYNLLLSLGLENIPMYRRWEVYVPGNYEDAISTDLSRFTEYITDAHQMEVQYNMIRRNYRFNVGVQAEPQHTSFRQNYQGKATNTTRNVVNYSPTLDFRYEFNKQHQLRLRYRGETSQPSMSDMVDIKDDSDPLNVTEGNPGLKPSFTNSLNFNYNNFIQNHTQAINAFTRISVTQNATTRRVTYVEDTGGRITRPENINGNWNAAAGGMYSVALDSAGVWNVSTNTFYSYNNYVGLVSSAQANSQRNVTRSHNINEQLSGSYRNSWLEFEVDGSINYTSSKNQLQPTANLNTWSFSYGASTTITAPWGTSIASDIHMRSRRGYSDASLNTNELIWNAQLSQTFLRQKNLTLMLQFYDILKNQSNLSRQINAMQRSDTEYNAINSYAMLHVIFRFNSFGGKKHGGEEPRPDFHRPEFRGRPGMGRPGGMHPGGFGGPR